MTEMKSIAVEGYRVWLCILRDHLIITSGYPFWYCYSAQNPHCGELSWKESSDDHTHQLIAQRQGGPVYVYCDEVGCHVLCLRHGILQCGSTLVKVPLLQTGTVVVRPQLVTNEILPQPTNT